MTKTFFAGDKALKADGAKTQVISLKVKNEQNEN
jgi:hypothetical protein